MEESPSEREEIKKSRRFPHPSCELGSHIILPGSGEFRDALGRTLPPQAQRLFARLAQYDRHSRICGHEVSENTLWGLQRVIEILNLLESVRDRAIYLYNKATQESGAVFSTPVIMACCLCFAIRESKAQRSNPKIIQDVITTFQRLGYRIPNRRFTQAWITLKSNLGVDLKTRRSEDYLDAVLTKVFASPAVISRLQQAGVSPEKYRAETFSEALKLLGEINSIKRSGRNPYLMAVAAVYKAEKKVAENHIIKPTLTSRPLANATGTSARILMNYCHLFKRPSTDREAQRHA